MRGSADGEVWSRRSHVCHRWVSQLNQTTGEWTGEREIIGECGGLSIGGKGWLWGDFVRVAERVEKGRRDDESEYTDLVHE